MDITVVDDGDARITGYGGVGKFAARVEGVRSGSSVGWNFTFSNSNESTTFVFQGTIVDKNNLRGLLYFPPITDCNSQSICTPEPRPLWLKRR
jgi:hypothetical protein